MAGTVLTQGNDGPIPSPFAGIAQAQQSTASIAAAAAVQQNSVVLDQYQNACLIIGNLNQVVTIGAGWLSGSPVVGVEVGTALTGFGLAYPTNFVHTTITTTQGSTAATVTSGSGISNGMVVGATVLESPPNPSASQPPNYIAPGTTITISGTSVTLSINALLSGSGLYACFCSWVAIGGVVHP